MDTNIFSDGSVFFSGCNYWASNAGTFMWRKWDPAAVERDFKQLSAHGVTVLRCFPLWSDFQPLTEEEKQGLKAGWITNRSELNEMETAGIAEAEIWLMTNKKDILSESFLKTLHKKMFGEVWLWAGSFRTTERNIGVAPYNIQPELRKLFDDIKYWIENKTYPEKEIAIRFHHRLVQIHPFPNGNGRISRLMADLLMRPELNYEMLAEIDPERVALPEDVTEQVEIELKYEGYIKRQMSQVEKFRKMEHKKIPVDIDYDAIPSIRIEARQKLKQVRPENVGQASRISGVSPSDISVLLVYLGR